MNSPAEESALEKIVNPYNTLTLSSHVFEINQASKPKEDWVEANSKLLGELKPQAWLVQLLATLAYDRETEISKIIDPSQVIGVSTRLKGEHEPIFENADWVTANQKAMEEVGVEKWLWTLLHVLETGGALT